MASKRRGGRPRLGYDGMGTDLIVFALIGAAALWGIHYWNAKAARPFHLGRVPLPAAVSKLPGPIRRWLRPDSPIVANAASAPEQPAPNLPSGPREVSPPAPAAPTPAIAPPVGEPSTESLPAPQATLATPSPDTEKSQVAATVTSLSPKISDSPSALRAFATALAERDGTLYLGLPDGGVAICPGASSGKSHGSVVRLPVAAGAVRAIAVGGQGTVWWLAGNSGTLYSYRTKGKILRSLDLTMLGTAVAASDGLAVLPGQSDYGSVVLMGKGSTTIIDGGTGAVRSLNDGLPSAAATALESPQSSALFASDAAKNEIMLLVVTGDAGAPGSPASLSLWTSKFVASAADAWEPQPIDGANVPAYSALRLTESGRCCAALGAAGIALLAKPAGGQTLAACNLWTTPIAKGGPLNLQPYRTLPDGVFGLWAAPDRITLGGSGLWWTFGGTIFHATLPGGKPEAYLPWNGAGDDKHGKIASLLADDKGLWVAADTGVRRIVPGHPTADLGYGGYVRAPLGPDVAQAPGNSTDQKLAQLTQEWQGTRYKWGGDSKEGIDCSGYVCKLFGGVGVTVPRATGELANGSEGKRIRDDLKYGDVLIFPGHCGMYIGNGWTTEALDAGVGKAAIWSRKNVVVKRFLK